MTAPRTIGIGILGFGTVGQGVWKHLHEKQADLESRLGVKLDLRKASVRDLKKKRAVKIPASKLTTNVNEIIDDPKVHVVCELIGGTTKARELTLRALRLGKVVVSANKALLCEHGPDHAGGPPAWRAVPLRSQRRRRHPDHQGHPRRTRRQPLRTDRRHPQRHL
jgi:homoserine dehydrogenase